MVPLESRIKRKILKELRRDYPQGVWYKIHGGPHQIRGIPDIIGCLAGRFIAFEIKRPDDKYRPPTPYQLKEILAIKKASGVVAVVTGYDEIKVILTKFFPKTP